MRARYYARQAGAWPDKCCNPVCFFAPTFGGRPVSRRHQIVVCARRGPVLGVRPLRACPLGRPAGPMVLGPATRRCVAAATDDRPNGSAPCKMRPRASAPSQPMSELAAAVADALAQRDGERDPLARGGPAGARPRRSDRAARTPRALAARAKRWGPPLIRRRCPSWKRAFVTSCCGTCRRRPWPRPSPSSRRTMPPMCWRAWTQSDRQAILAQIPTVDRAALERNLEYPEETAGRLMQTDFVAVPPVLDRRPGDRPHA